MRVRAAVLGLFAVKLQPLGSDALRLGLRLRRDTVQIAHQPRQVLQHARQILQRLRVPLLVRVLLRPLPLQQQLPVRRQLAVFCGLVRHRHGILLPPLDQVAVKLLVVADRAHRHVDRARGGGDQTREPVGLMVARLPVRFLLYACCELFPLICPSITRSHDFDLADADAVLFGQLRIGRLCGDIFHFQSIPVLIRHAHTSMFTAYKKPAGISIPAGLNTKTMLFYSAQP